MTQLYTDFSEYTVDVAPSDWTRQFGTRSYIVRADAAATGGKLLEISGAASLDFFVWNAVNALADRDDSEVLFRFRVSGGSSEIRAVQRGRDNTGREGYICGARPDSSSINTSKFTAGTFGDLPPSVGKSTVIGDWYWCSSIVRGTSIELRTWPDSGSRPAIADISTTDDGISAAGWIGLYSNRADTVEIDTFAVGTGTDDAPLEQPPSVSISNINTNNEVAPGTTATVNGIGFTGGTGFSLGSEAQSSFTVVSDTSVTFTTVRGGNPYNQDLTGTLLHPGGNATITVQQVPEAGTFAVTAASPNTTDDASLWTGLVDTATSNPITIVDGDQAWVKNPNNLTNLAIQPDGTITADQTGDFVVQIWLQSEGVWGSDQTVTFTDGTADVTAPTVSSVSVPTAGSYKAGDTLSFTVNFSETVNVTGTPQLALNIGSTTRHADYASGTGTSALVFSYTVQAGDNDADGISVGTLALNGGTIQDAATNAANLSLNSVGVTSGVLVDTIRPVITVTGANPLNITVGDTFSDPGATASDNQDGSLGSVTGTGSVDGQTEGQYIITYPGAGVVDSAGNVALDVTRVVNVNAVDAWPFGKRISYAAPKTWTWGGRHPKTGMRVRIFK